MPAQPAASARADEIARIVVLFIAVSYRLRGREAPSAFDGRRVERAAVGVLREEHRERDRGRRDELELREALLAEAVVEAPLERAHLALRDPVGGPRAVGALHVRGLREVGKVLQPDPL